MQSDYTKLIAAFAPMFSSQVWPYVLTLLTGAILAHGQRTVSAILRVTGLGDEAHFGNFHRVLNRARWWPLKLSRLLLQTLIETFVPAGMIVMGGDDTIERRRGDQISAKGIYRDPVRSSHSHFVKASGLRWLSVMLLAKVPWAQRVWALPFLTCLCPSERFYERQGRAHKKLTDWMRQTLLLIRRWLPDRMIVFVADSSYAVIGLLARMQQLRHPIIMITRLRLDAALYATAPPRKKGQNGRPRKKGLRLPTLQKVAEDARTLWQPITLPDWYGQAKRDIEIVSSTAVWFHSGQPAVPMRWVLIRDPLGKFKTQALLCTDVSIDPLQIVRWFIQRWNLEVTFREVREHLGVETQRQWSDNAIARTTPALLGLFSLVTLLAHSHVQRGRLTVRTTAWYAKTRPTFSDALAIVRRQLWLSGGFCMSHAYSPVQKLDPHLLNRLDFALCYSN
jgi:hypothetical protein